MTLRALVFAFLLGWAGTSVSEAKENVELFSDKGDSFIRAGTRQGLRVGETVTIVGDRIADTEERRTVGTASVLEVWPTLARVSLDKSAQAATGEKFAKVTPKATVKKLAAASPVQSDADSLPPARKAFEPTGPRLAGHAAKNPIGRITVFNDGAAEWTDCELRLPDQSHATLSHLAGGAKDSFMPFAFKSDPEPPVDWVYVHCDEGHAKMEFANAAGGGALKGHLERGGMSRIILYNDSPKAWNRCNAKLPNGADYVIGNLEAHDQIRIAPGDFKKPEVRNDAILVQCKQGGAKFAF